MSLNIPDPIPAVEVVKDQEIKSILLAMREDIIKIYENALTEENLITAGIAKYDERGNFVKND